jgi:hypothetical protein
MQRNNPVAPEESVVALTTEQLNKYSVSPERTENPWQHLPPEGQIWIPAHMRQYRLIKRRDFWIEAPVDDHWTVAFRLVSNEELHPVVGEIRIFPAEHKREPGRWSAEVRGVEAKVPSGGITARLLRNVRFGVAEAKIRELMQWLQDRYAGMDHDPDMLEQTSFRPAPSKGRSTRGRKPQPDKFYAQLASDYLDECPFGRPIAYLAEQRGLPINTVRDLIHYCRTHGFLTKVGRGKRGGELTPKAQALLQQGGNPDENDAVDK